AEADGAAALPANHGNRPPVLQYVNLFELGWPRSASGRTADTEDPAGQRQFFVGEEAWQPAPVAVADERRLLDELTHHEFSIGELEDHIRTLRPHDIDQQYPLYSALAEAYRIHGRLEAQLAGLTAAIQSGGAG